MLSSEDASVIEIARRLRNGTHGAEHAPSAIAELLDALLRDRRALRAERDELEQLALTRRTAALERNAYARGWRAALRKVCETFSGDTELERAIADLAPDFGQASVETQNAA